MDRFAAVDCLNGLVYQTKRIDGRIVHIYFGSGPLAEYIAYLDDKARAQRKAKAEAVKAEQAEWRAHEKPLQDFCDVGDLLAKAALLAAGYRRHDRGEWRRCKHGASD